MKRNVPKTEKKIKFDTDYKTLLAVIFFMQYLTYIFKSYVTVYILDPVNCLPNFKTNEKTENVFLKDFLIFVYVTI